MLKLDSFQTALFVNNLNLDNKLKIASDIVSINKGIFNGEPVILPIPLKAQPEIPRIIVKSKDEKYSCNVGLNRVDLFFNLKDKKEQFWDIIRGEYLDILLPIVSFMKENYNVLINRIGFISNLSLILNESSNDYIIHKYMKEGGLISGTYDLQIHALNKIDLADEIKANRWLRIITTRSISQPDNDKCLVISIDINSDPDVPRNFDIELIRRFFSSTIEHIKDLMEQHYGENLLC